MGYNVNNVNALIWLNKQNLEIKHVESILISKTPWEKHPYISLIHYHTNNFKRYWIIGILGNTEVALSAQHSRFRDLRDKFCPYLSSSARIITTLGSSECFSAILHRLSSVLGKSPRFVVVLSRQFFPATCSCERLGPVLGCSTWFSGYFDPSRVVLARAPPAHNTPASSTATLIYTLQGTERERVWERNSERGKQCVTEKQWERETVCVCDFKLLLLGCGRYESSAAPWFHSLLCAGHHGRWDTHMIGVALQHKHTDLLLTKC